MPTRSIGTDPLGGPIPREPDESREPDRSSGIRPDPRTFRAVDDSSRSSSCCRRSPCCSLWGRLNGNVLRLDLLPGSSPRGASRSGGVWISLELGRSPLIGASHLDGYLWTNDEQNLPAAQRRLTEILGAGRATSQALVVRRSNSDRG